LDLVAAAQQPHHHQQPEQPEQQQQQQQQQDPALQAQPRPCPSPPKQQASKQPEQQQQQAPRGWDPLIDWFSAKTTGSDPQRDALPRHLHWVTPAWLADSIAAGAR
jgi:hypothetical protein